GEPTHGVRALFFRGRDHGGRKTRVFAYYGCPARKSGERVPAIVLVHGGGGTAYDVWVKQWCERGYAALALDTTGGFPSEEGRGRSYSEGQRVPYTPRTRSELGEYVSGPENDEARTMHLPPEETWLYHAVSAVILAHSLLRTFPEVDAHRVGIMGISWGGVVTSHTLAYDRRFAFAIPVYGSAYLATGDSKLNRIYRDFGVDRYFDAQRDLAALPFPVLWQCHDRDSNFSVDANVRSYLATKGSGAVLAITAMGHAHTCAWSREEPFLFADGAIGRGEGLCRIKEEPQGFGDVSFTVALTKIAKDVRAVCHYLTTRMAFDEKGSPTYEWQHTPAAMHGERVSLTLPREACGYYVTLEWQEGGKRLSVSTVYLEKNEADT
ncbi:MAG: acetylxylan esterase, partial [Clostridia bacterium]|nr:acetylxylan esterase [Clostridia bacterium]